MRLNNSSENTTATKEYAELTSTTIDYYNNWAEEYYRDTVDVDMSELYHSFEKYIGENAHILDCGCGSGRDTKHFLDEGFKVTAIDGSAELCKEASELTGTNVYNMVFQDIDFEDVFDGVWACASLLHVPIEELPEIFCKLKEALVDRGIIYASFKYGDFEGERNGRFYTDLTEESLKEVISEVEELSIQDLFITNDNKTDHSEEKWLNVILVCDKRAHIQKISNDDIDVIKGEIVIDNTDNKVLIVKEDMEDTDFPGVVNRVLQCMNMGAVISSIEKGAEYVVQIPVKYQKQFESGEYFLNRNKTTGLEFPTLMKKAPNGRYQFVDALPIKKQEFIKGNPFQDICNNYHNIYMQQQIAQLAEAVRETYEVAKLIMEGQQDDRIALIEAGREEIELALTLKDPEARKRHIEQGRNNLITGKSQLGKALERRINRFDPIPKNPILRFGKSCLKSKYLDKKDDEYEKIEECFILYNKATRLLAMSWGLTGELDALQSTYDGSISFIKQLDYTNIKTIEYSHEKSDLSNLFYKSGIPGMRKEKKVCLNAAENYDYISIEISGDELLEVIENDKIK